ncbi:unnamed protein product [Cuscuta epithymum]|uniref:Uncharacterized protein n=1 Tax=Cuscuta epithymum TaxID=186058 RepID=A0AAV0E1V3_9ASTE|nr:unnamed protein product [Cuscuta epithymum]CAH9133937.1 unnamed protein product [Cuscuta epithymum]
MHFLLKNNGVMSFFQGVLRFSIINICEDNNKEFEAFLSDLGGGVLTGGFIKQCEICYELGHGDDMYTLGCACNLWYCRRCDAFYDLGFLRELRNPFHYALTRGSFVHFWCS